MDWEKLFNQHKPTSLTKIKRIYRSLNLNVKAKILSVVGTNGKGSLVNYIAQGLMHNKIKVGTFTSPHILNANERIKINDVPISNQEVAKIIKRLPTDLHFFGLMFLIAMVYFAEQDVDIIILEAGIGGKEDSTNALKVDYGLVTSIDLEHQEILGNSLIEIAKQKAGIINNGITFFIPSQLKNKIQEIFIAKVMRTKSASFHIINNSSISYQSRNKLLAQAVLKKAFDIEFSNFVNLPGRTQIVSKNGLNLVYDVGHNLAAFKAVVQQLQKNKIEYQNVIICLAKRKAKEGLVEIFKNKKIYGFQLNQNFWSAKALNVSPIENFENFEITKSTLFIGSFYFIQYLWQNHKNLI